MKYSKESTHTCQLNIWYWSNIQRVKCSICISFHLGCKQPRTWQCCDVYVTSRFKPLSGFKASQPVMGFKAGHPPALKLANMQSNNWTCTHANVDAECYTIDNRYYVTRMRNYKYGTVVVVLCDIITLETVCARIMAEPRGKVIEWCWNHDVCWPKYCDITVYNSK